VEPTSEHGSPPPDLLPFALDDHRVHNASTVAGTGPVIITTPRDRWAYAAEFVRRQSAEAGPTPAVVCVRLRVLEGVVGIGCLGYDGAYMVEAQRTPGDGDAEVELPLSSLGACRSLMVRNTSADLEASRVEIRSVTVRPVVGELTDEREIEISVDGDLIAPFRVWSGTTPAGYWTNWLGVRTRAAVWTFTDDIVAAFSKERQDHPRFMPVDENSLDWVPLLQAVLAAGQSFVMVALGAGWGRWLSAGAFAARQTGRDYRLVGVEAEPTHFRWMQEHFDENGLDPDRYRLLEAAASAASGSCWFQIGRAADWYGQSISPAAAASDDRTAPAAVGTVVEADGMKLQRVRCVDIEEVMAGLPRADYMHMDVQGAELDFLAAKPAVLQARVKMVNIGTHSEAIERGLRRLFTSLGWSCRYDVPMNGKVLMKFGSMKPCSIPFGDGVQVWVNEAL
jgi:FkbM family methyltransferase